MNLQGVTSILTLFLYFQCSVQCDNNDNSNDITVNTELGRIRGTTLHTRLGKPFYAFRGIRYAKPPINEYRFKAPQPVEPWENIFDATSDGPICPQPIRPSLANYSEDCLRLNVYTRNLPNRNQRMKPVIIYIHPGGFYASSGVSNFFGPQYWMDRDVVLVSINYRLGTLGFLATGTKEAPGNAGLKDQVLAMKWVQKHISKFNGDPNSVTLVGYSAGAGSISLHIISPMSRNLFHKAIIQSGSTKVQRETPYHQIDLAVRQARLLNCSQENISEIIKCFNTTNTEDFVRTVRDMFDYGNGQPILLWSPVIEPDFGQERFLIEDPLISLRKGNFMRIPIISGITKDEFAAPAINILRNDTLRRDLDENWEHLAPICFLYERDTERSRNISVTLRKTFLSDEPLSLENSKTGLNHLFADAVIGFSIHRIVHIISKFTTIYYYRFSYQGRYSYFYYPDNKPYGVVHHDDLLYLFHVPSRSPILTKNDPEDKTIERMTRMWSQFAKTGNPNVPNYKYFKGVDWQPFSSKLENYMDIGDDLVMKRRLYTNRYSVWESLFPLPPLN